MPAVAVCDVDTILTGHGCDAIAGIQPSLQTKVTTLGGKFIAIRGDAIKPHTILSGGVCVPHSAIINAGSDKVFIGGIPIARVGDSADAGQVQTGSAKITAGGLSI